MKLLQKAEKEQERKKKEREKQRKETQHFENAIRRIMKLEI